MGDSPRADIFFGLVLDHSPDFDSDDDNDSDDDDNEEDSDDDDVAQEEDDDNDDDDGDDDEDADQDDTPVIIKPAGRVIPQKILDAITSYEWAPLYLKRKSLPRLKGFNAERNVAEISGCTIDSHGYHGDPQFYLAIKSSCIGGDWDGATELNPQHFIIQPDWLQKLKDFCAVMEIPWVEPKWFLVASLNA